MIPAGYSELQHAYEGHTRLADTGTEASYHLLFFYGLECGLKTIYLKRNKLSHTDQIHDERLRGTHDLSLLLKELRLPAHFVDNSFSSFRLKRGRTAWPIKEAHIIWRYGIAMDPDDQKKLVGWMHAVCNWIKEAL